MPDASDSETNKLLKEIVGNTREIVNWLRLAHRDTARQIINEVLDDARKVLAYEYSTGDLSSRAVSMKAKVSDKSIRDWWREWLAVGLVVPSEVEGRYERVFDLRQLGITVPTS